MTLAICLGMSAAMAQSSTQIRKAATAQEQPAETTFNFARSSGGWDTLFGQYPRGQESTLRLERGYAPVPRSDVNPQVCTLPEPDCMPYEKVALYFKAQQSSQLVPFMFKAIEGLQANTQYYLADVRVTLASNTLAGSVGAGGSPVIPIRMGVSNRRPEADPYNNNNLNVAVRSTGIALGDTGITLPSGKPLGTFVDKTLVSAGFGTGRMQFIQFKTDAQGRAWVWLAGLPTHFGSSEFYVRDIAFRLERDGQIGITGRQTTQGGSLRLPF